VYYNKVKTEYAKSEFLEASITKSSVASQILLLSDPNRSLDPEALVSEQFKLAEYFINIMSLPDSALVVYDKIIANKDHLVSQLDTLNTALETERINFEATQDSLESAHTQAIVADTLRIDMIEAIADSLIVEDTQSDSTSQNYLRTAYEKSAQYREIKNKIDSVNRILNEYDVKILPFTHFVKAWIYKNLKDSSESAELIYTTLSQNFPHNEYTYACSLMLAGEQPDLMTPMQRINQSNYDTAIDIMESNPDSALVLIKSFTDDKGSEFYLNSLYTTGYINYFVKGDTLAARPWFDKLLEEDAKDKYRVNVSTFYQNGLFLTTEIVNENEGTDNDLREESLSHPDSLMKSTVIDSLDFPKAIPADEFFPE
jgi:tetratricopeptide (TPR) repeat protein